MAEIYLYAVWIQVNIFIQKKNENCLMDEIIVAKNIPQSFIYSLVQQIFIEHLHVPDMFPPPRDKAVNKQVPALKGLPF